MRNFNPVNPCDPCGCFNPICTPIIVRGATGITGSTGNTGATGATGATGPKGRSACDSVHYATFAGKSGNLFSSGIILINFYNFRLIFKKSIEIFLTSNRKN